MSTGMILGIGLIITTLVFAVVGWSLMRLFPNRDSIAEIENTSQVRPEIDASGEAVLVIQAGGRVEYINPRAREWFGLQDDDAADIEQLARRVHPADEFLEVLATPGQKRVNVNGRLAEFTSYQVPGIYPKMLISLRGMELTPAFPSESADSSASIFKVIADFSQAITSNLDLETVLSSILENLDRLIPADIVEIKVWTAEAQAFNHNC